MAEVKAKLEVLIDLTRPVEELVQIVTLVINSHPGKQKEILEAIDMYVGEALTSMNNVENDVSI